MSGLSDELDEETSTVVADLRATVRRLQRSVDQERDRTAAVAGAVRTAIADGIAGLSFAPVVPPPKDRRRAGEETAVLLISDIQLGKVTPSYSSLVAEERVARLREKVDRIVAIQRAEHPVKRIAIFLLGDIIEGELIFPGQAWQIDSSLYRQVTVDGPRIIGDTVRWAASRFERVDVFAVPGNHGHLGGRGHRDMHPESNGDRMLYQIVAQLTAGLPNVSWSIAEDWWQVADLGDRCRFMLMHGDNVRGVNGVPWYGWTRRVMSLASMTRIWEGMDFDHVAAGHFHTPVSLYVNGRRLWINASTESHNPYALEQMGAAGEPAQWLLFALPGRGVTAEYLVSLADEPKKEI